jgi:hypothetical protein
MQCISCGHDDRPLSPVKDAFLPQQYLICDVCRAKHTGLAKEADRLMLEYKEPEVYVCLMCQAVVPFDAAGTVPMYCDECMNKIFNDSRHLRK